MPRNRSWLFTLIGVVILVLMVSGNPATVQAYDPGDQVEIGKIGEVVDVLRLGFWHWSHASGDPDPNDAHEGINDADDSVGDHQCTFTTTPYSEWDSVAEDYGASHWPFTLDPNNVMTCVMTVPQPGQYIVAFQALVNLAGNYHMDYKKNGVWTPLNTFNADPNFPADEPVPDPYQTIIPAFVVETDAGQTEIQLRFYSTGHKLSLSGIVLGKIIEDPFAGKATSGFYHGNSLFDKSKASALYASFLADPFLTQRYNHCLGRAVVNNPSQFDQAPANKNVTGYREELLMNSVLSAINGNVNMRNLAIELIMKPTNWIEWRNLGPLYHAGMLRVMATGYDHLYDHMTPAQRDAVRRRLDTEAMWIYIQSLTQAWWSPDGRANNWQAVCHAGLGFAGLVLREESLRAPQYLDWAKYQTKLYVKSTLTASGSCREAYGSYYTYGLGNADVFFVILKNITGEDLLGYDNDVIQKTVPYSLYLLDPLMDGFCSFDDAGHGYSPATVMASMVKYRQDTLAQWMVQNYMGEHSSLSSYPGWRAWEQLFPLLWHDGNVPMEDPETSPRTPLAQVFAEDGPPGEGRWGSGHVIMRSGFTSPDDIWFVLQCGDSGGYHGHVDQGSFILSAYGGHLVTDYGRKYWSREYTSHSLVLIDDVGQINDHFNGNGRMKRDGTIDDFHHDPNIADYALANSQLAYDNNNNPVDHSLRHVLFVRKPQRRGYFVIADDIKSSTPGTHDYSWLLHTANWHKVILQTNGQFRIEQSSDQYYKANEYQGREADLQVILATPQDPTMKVVTRQYDDPTESRIVPYVRATQTSDRGVFVALMYPESDRLSIYTPAVTRVDVGDLAGFELNDDLVLFHKGTGVWTYADVQSDARMVYLDRSVEGEVTYLVANATTLRIAGQEIFSASAPTTASGTFSGLPVDEVPPTVLAWYSAAEHGRGVGEAPLEIPDDGSFSEPRSSGISKLVVQFSESMNPLNFNDGQVEIAGLDANGAPVNLSGVAIAATLTAGDMIGEVTFTPALPDYARYIVRITGATDVAGNPIGSDNDRIITALRGDASGDLRVNASDFSRVRSARTKLINPGNVDEVRCDVSCDGRVNVSDLSRIRARRPNDATGIADPMLP